MSKRAEVRRKQKEKKKAAEREKWAKNKSDREWIREQRKKVGLPVDDPTPTSSEAAYEQRETEQQLRKRVRRMSHQLLIAAAIGKQYREATMADHSGHVVRGADRGVSLQYRPFDARSDTSLTATDAMARSFRNWVNRKKAGRVRSRSSTPDTVVSGIETAGPEDTPSESGSNSSHNDNDDDAPTIAGPTALRAIIHDAAFTDEDNSDSDTDDDFSGFTGLDADDVSDEVMATAYAMLAAAKNTDRGRGRWADILANDIVESILLNRHATPSTVELNIPSTSDSDPGSGSDSDVVPAGMSGHNSRRRARGRHHNKNRNGARATKRKPKKATKTREKIPSELKAALNFLKQQRQQSALDRPPVLSSSRPEDDNSGGHKGASRWTPNKPVAPHQSVWDPTWWRSNTKDGDDGIRAGKLAAHRQPTDKMETGFITWAEQEAKFPRLDTGLRLHRVRGSRPLIFDPSTVDTRIWDPLNRTVVEPRTGTRAPLHLNPVTTHSLALWTMDRPGNEYSLDPIKLPDNPPVEDKKRPMPSTTLSQSQGATRNKGKGSGKPSFIRTAKIEIPTRETPAESTDESAVVASVHYPLRSPAAISISRSHPGGGQYDTARQTTPPPSYASFANIRPSLPGPPTPYPRAVVPDTPTVALYERGAASWKGDAMSIIEEKADEEVEAKEDEDERPAAFLPRPGTSGSGSGSGYGGSNQAKKRATEPDFGILESPSRKKRRTDVNDPADAESEEKERIKEAAVERELEPHSVHASNEVPPYDEPAAAAPGDKEEGYLSPEDQQLYSSTPEQRALNPQDDVAAPLIPEPELGSGAQEAQQELYDPEDDDDAQSVADPKSQELRDPGDDDDDDDDAQPTTPHVETADDATRGSGEKKSVRFQLSDGPSSGMRHGARRALGRYGRTTLRLGSLGP